MADEVGNRILCFAVTGTSLAKRLCTSSAQFLMGVFIGFQLKGLNCEFIS